MRFWRCLSVSLATGAGRTVSISSDSQLFHSLLSFGVICLGGRLMTALLSAR
ncbi:MAG: hypothetical protein PUC85_04155 [bacterium]|nr:hypothetical protein [bacterium]